MKNAQVIVFQNGKAVKAGPLVTAGRARELAAGLKAKGFVVGISF